MLLPILKKSAFLLCTGTILVFTSCSEERPTTEKPVNDEKTTPRKLSPSKDEGVIRTESQAIEAEETTPQNSGANDGNAEVKINPPHGQPGHDCAVAVGDPLPSGPAVINPTINTPQSDPTNNSPTNNNSGNLNPPHGEPGHDCAVPVGQPLN